MADFDFKAETTAAWLNISPKNGKIEKEQRLLESVDWNKVPAGLQQIPITITGVNGAKVIVQATTNNKSMAANANTFVENNGYISIEAAQFN